MQFKWITSYKVYELIDLQNVGRIDDYFRARKRESFKRYTFTYSRQNDRVLKMICFIYFDMHPEDMNLQVVHVIPTKLFDTLLEKTASFSPDENPGKTNLS